MKGCSPVYTRDFGPRMLAAVQVHDVEKVGEHRAEWNDISVAAIPKTERHVAVKAEELARRWGCGIGTAHQALKVTTQHGMRKVVHPIMKSYKMDLIHGSNVRRLHERWFWTQCFTLHCL